MVSSLGTSLLSTALLILGYPVYLHFLGYEQYGVWLVLTTVLTVAQLSNYGIGSAVVKLVAEEHGRGNSLGIQRYVSTALVLLCAGGVLVLILLLILRRPVIALFALHRENAQLALWLLPYVGLLTMYILIVQVFEAALSGLGRMDLANYRGLLARATNLGVATGLLYLGFGIRSLLIARALAEVTTHLAAFVYLRRLTHLRLRHLLCFDLLRCKRLLAFGGTVLASSLLDMLLTPLNKLLLSRYLGVASLPVYEMAFTGSMQLKGLVGASQIAMIPEISRVSAEMTAQARARILHLYRRSLKLILLLGAPAYAGLAFLAPVLLRLWLRDRFLDTVPETLRILLLGTFLSVLGTPAYCTLVGMGHVPYSLMASIVQALTNLTAIFCVLAVLPLTIAAVAWASSLGMAAATVFLVLKKRSVLREAAAWRRVATAPDFDTPIIPRSTSCVSRQD
jgi:O-antigen/teichoic acid export membrane protein